MLAANTVPTVRIVATPAALDSFVTPLHKVALRIAPDELMILHAAVGDVSLVGDEHAIIEADHGFSLVAVSWPEFEQFIRPLIEWRIPESEFPCLSQGLVGFVPAKLWFTTDGVRVIVATSFVDTLLERMRSR